MGLIDFFKRRKAQKARVSTSPERNKVALCLGGGGARGFGHVGALKAFEEAGIDFDIVVGTSAGSLVGALYCYGLSADEIIAHAHELDPDDIRKGVFFRAKDAAPIGKVVSDIIGDVNIEQLKKPFAAVAVDLVSARQIILDKGKVADAVSASCCVPIFFKPYIIGDMHLVDGGVLNTVPADVCRLLGADKVVSIDINSTRGEGSSETGTIEVLKTSYGIMSKALASEGLRHSDVVINPDLKKFKATKKDGYEEMMRNGYDAAKARIDEIKALFAANSDAEDNNKKVGKK